MLDKLAFLPADLGRPEELLADAGSFSEANVAACAAGGIDPLIAPGRDAHHPPRTSALPLRQPPPRTRRRSTR